MPPDGVLSLVAPSLGAVERVVSVPHNLFVGLDPDASASQEGGEDAVALAQPRRRRVAGGTDNLIIDINANIVSANGNITLEAGDDLDQRLGGLIQNSWCRVRMHWKR